MTVGHIDDLAGKLLTGQDLRGVSRKIPISPLEGWRDHVLRVFEIAPGGHTPRHGHDWFHVNYILSGEGILVMDGVDHPVRSGSYAFVPAGVEHQFRNPGTTPFVFICVVPEAGDHSYRDR